jgi:hypothetical protein
MKTESEIREFSKAAKRAVVSFPDSEVDAIVARAIDATLDLILDEKTEGAELLMAFFAETQKTKTP